MPQQYLQKNLSLSLHHVVLSEFNCGKTKTFQIRLTPPNSSPCQDKCCLSLHTAWWFCSVTAKLKKSVGVDLISFLQQNAVLNNFSSDVCDCKMIHRTVMVMTYDSQGLDSLFLSSTSTGDSSLRFSSRSFPMYSSSCLRASSAWALLYHMHHCEFWYSVSRDCSAYAAAHLAFSWVRWSSRAVQAWGRGGILLGERQFVAGKANVWWIACWHCESQLL